MFCRNCGKQLEDGFKVCPYCGEPVSLAESDARRAAQEQTASEDTQPVHNNIPKEPAPLRQVIEIVHALYLFFFHVCLRELI